MSELKKIIVVVDPDKDSKLSDICFIASPLDIYHIAKGTNKDPADMNIKMYTTENLGVLATNDAQARLRKVRNQQ